MLYIPIQQRHPLLWKPSIVRDESKTFNIPAQKGLGLAKSSEAHVVDGAAVAGAARPEEGRTSAL